MKIAFRCFARKVISKTPQDFFSKPSPLSDEFEKYLKEEESKGKNPEEVFAKLMPNKSMSELLHALETGQEINLDNIDMTLPDDLVEKLEKVVEGSPEDKARQAIEKGLPLDIATRLNSIKKK